MRRLAAILIILALVGCKQQAVKAVAYETYLTGTAVTAEDAKLAGVTVAIGSRNSTTNASGVWGFYTSLVPGQTVQLSVTAPDGYRLRGQASFVAPAAANIVRRPALTFDWTAPTWTPWPTWTHTPTATPWVTTPTAEATPALPPDTPGLLRVKVRGTAIYTGMGPVEIEVE